MAMYETRRKKGYSVKELSEKAGVSEGTIYHSEKDKTYPGVLTLVALADVLGVSVDEYIGREQREDEKK